MNFQNVRILYLLCELFYFYSYCILSIRLLMPFFHILKVLLSLKEDSLFCLSIYLESFIKYVYLIIIIIIIIFIYYFIIFIFLLFYILSYYFFNFNYLFYFNLHLYSPNHQFVNNISRIQYILF
jgi:small-conductance mechanosensitive channel